MKRKLATASYEAAPNKQDSHSTALLANPAMSRRVFLKGATATGALVFLGSIITPRGLAINAYADESGNNSFVIYVLSRDEVPIFTFDPSNNNEAIPQVDVQITSLYNGKTTSVTTDDVGCKLVSIRELATECDDADATRYTFYGDVYAQKEGYRLVHIPTCYFESAVIADEDGTRPNTVQIPLQVAETDIPYLMSASLDGYDIQYEVSTAYVGLHNDMEHELKVEVVTQEPNTPLNVTLMVNNPNAAEVYSVGSENAVSTSTAPYVATVTFKGLFLSEKTIPDGGTEADAINTEAIPAGWDLFIGFVDSSFRMNFLRCPVTFEQGGVLADSGFASFSISPGSQSDGTEEESGQIALPSWFDERDQFTTSFPFLGIEIFCEGGRNFGIAANLAQLTLVKDRNGVSKLKDGESYEFKGFRGLHAKKEFEDFKKEVSKTWNDAKDLSESRKNANRTISKAKVSSKVDVDLDLILKGYGTLESEWKAEPRLWSANIAAILKLNLNFSYTQQYFIWFIPVFWTFDLSIYAELAVRWIFGFEDCFKNINWHYLSDKTESPVDMVLVFHFEAGLSVGIGIAGLASISIRGYGYIRYVFTFVDSSLSLPHPRVQLYAKAGAELTAQLLIFKKTFIIVETGESNDPLFDNWEETAALTAAAERAAAALIPDTLAPNDMVGGQLITDDELALTVEFAGTVIEPDAATLAAAGEDQPIEPTIEYARIRPAVEASASLASDEQLAPTCKQVYEDDSYNPMYGMKIENGLQKLAEGVYSNSRLKVFGEGDNIFYARIATVQVPGSASGDGETYPRTRIVLSRWNGSSFGEESVVDFWKADCTSDLEITSPMRYDVDFDIVYVEDGWRQYAAIGITSLTYPDLRIEDSELTEEMVNEFSNQRFCTLVLYELFDNTLLWQSACYFAQEDDTSATGYKRTYSSFSPRVVIHPYPCDPDSEKNPPADQLVTMFHYEQSLESGSESVFAYTSFLLQPEKQKYITDIGSFYPVQASFPVAMSDLINGSFTVSAGNKTSSIYASTSQGYRWSSLVVLGWSGVDSTLESTENSGSSFVMELLMFEHSALPWVTEYTSDGGAISLPGVSSLMPRAKKASDDLFVYTNDTIDNPTKKFHIMSIDSSSLYISDRECDQGTINTRFFPSRDGNYLYAVKVYDGEIPPVSEEVQKQVEAGATIMSNCYSDTDGYTTMATPKSAQGGAVQRYELLETRWISGLSCYHEFYPIAQLDFNPYDIEVITASGSGQREFVITDLTDFSTSHADIYRFSAPVTLAMHLVSVFPATDIALPGEDVKYDITVANTGNTLITSFYVDIYDDSENLVAHDKHANLQDAIQEGSHNLEYVCDEYGNRKYDDSGNPITAKTTDARDLAGILWPGTTRTYRFTFKMPEGYEGQTNFSAKISSPASTASDLSENGILQLSADAALLAENEDWSWISELDFIGDEIGDDVGQCVDPNIRQFGNAVSADDCGVSKGSVASVTGIKKAVYKQDLSDDEEDPTPSPSPSESPSPSPSPSESPSEGDDPSSSPSSSSGTAADTEASSSPNDSAESSKTQSGKTGDNNAVGVLLGATAAATAGIVIAGKLSHDAEEADTTE